MKTTWEYSSNTEALRLLHVAHQISTNFFKVNGFIVLPHPCPTADNLVSFPDLRYLSIPRFWQRVSRLNITDLPVIAPSDLVVMVTKLLEKAKLPPPNYTHIQKTWSTHQEQIISEIYRLIPHKKNSITDIVIMPTNFGTSCSFNWVSQTPSPIYIWLRPDQGIAAITEAILSSITRPDVYHQLGGMWSESEIIVDWLMSYSSFGVMLQKIDPSFSKSLTIKTTRAKQSANLIQKSEAYLQRIGAPSVSLETIKSLPTKSFTSREKDILDTLISHSPLPVTMDEIGDIIFKSKPDSYSLSAIAKTIQRLRDRLEQNGISGSFIQTKRGEGYLLIN